MRKVVSFLMIAVFLIAPVSAASSSSPDVEYVQKSGFWTWAAGEPGTGWNKFIGYTFGAVCPNSEDGYHHASSYKRPQASWGGLTGYYTCICDLCGAEFTGYESDLQQSYDAQVEELPAPGYNSLGALEWYLQPVNGIFGNRLTHGYDVYDFNLDTYFSFLGTLRSSSISSKDSVGISFDFITPVTGSYTFTPYVTLTNCSVGAVGAYNGDLAFHNKDYIAGQLLYLYFGAKPFNSGLVAFSGCMILRCVPFDLNMSVYNINSRPTSIVGDYGIIGDNGQIIKVEGDKIVNETNNTYYNPATGTTDTITDWSYNYEDRSYTLTLGGGTTTTVTYGDENVVIKEGDTTYNIYYLVDGSGSENPGPDIPGVCDHTWTETSRTDPACTTAGKIISQCSECGQTKTEPLPATGHTWVVDRTVQTTYDEEGNLLQQGYTIYSCSVCGEQYKDMEGVGPPGGEEEKSIWEKIGDLLGSGFGGIIEIIEAILGKILDALTSLIDMLMGKLKYIVESVLSIFDELPALFGGFLDFLAAIFPFLPPEITTILTFGVIAITFIGILKAVRR